MPIERDDIVKVRGTMELYNDRPQLIVQRIRRCEDGEFQEADCWPASARDPEEMFRELQGFVDSVGNEYVRSLLQSVLNDPFVVTAMKVVPGGVRLHHPCRGGLLDHVTSVCHLAEKVIEHYPRLNRGLANCWSHPPRHRQGRGAWYLAPLGLPDARAARRTRRLGPGDSAATT